MRKIGMALSLLGGFLVVLALTAVFYAPGQLMRTPLNVDSTTRLAGTATLTGAEGPETFPVKATSLTRVNSAKSTSDVVVFVSSSCLVKDEGNPPNCVSVDDPQNRLISAGVDNFATDRKTAIAVNDPKLLPADAGERKGLVNKWPFQAEKKTYPYWDDMVGGTIPAKYIGSGKLLGLDVYKYSAKVADAPIQIAEGVPGKYSTQLTFFVEPLTGSIVNQIQKQQRVTEAGDPVLDLSIEFTKAQQKTSVDESKSDVFKLTMVRKMVPIVGFVVGIPLLIAGTVLASRRRETDQQA